MRRRLLLALSPILFLSLIGIRPLAADETLLLWSPGGEGSAEQAAPLLEAWMDYLTSKGLKSSLKAVYSNASLSEGAEQIKKLKPVAGIISLEAYLALADKEPLTLLSQTRKLPRSDGTSQYVILKNKQSAAPESLWLSEPLTATYTQRIVLSESADLFQELPQHHTDQVLYKLKQVGQGDLNAAVLVSDYQAAILNQLPSEWAKSLKPVAHSPILPAPPVVLFENRKGSFPSDQLTQILLQMDQDPEGQQILRELRLTGFMEPDREAYARWQQAFGAPPSPPQ